MAQVSNRKAGVVVAEPAIEELRARLRGDLITRNDDEYEAARKVFNAMIDRHPALIVRCADVADVMAAVDFARDNRLTLAIRGGGHNVAGFGSCDDGLVIDMSRMKGIRVDPQSRTVRADGGCTWGDVDHATHAFGFATPGGVISTTGIAGLTLGGGIGNLTRRCGLSCDNLISADVVTADGRLVTASAKVNSDLFWAIRGGGGNFGVVTSFELRLHEVSTVYAGPIVWPLDRAADAMNFYRGFMRNAPDELNVLFAFLVVPPGPPFPEQLHGRNMCAAVVCYSGPPEKGEGVVRPLQEFGPPAFHALGPMPFPMLQGAFDPVAPPGLHHYWKADFVSDLSQEVIAGHAKFGPGVPNIFSGTHIFPISGAAHRVGKSETAWSYRDAHFAHVIYAASPDPADTPKNTEWVRSYFDALHPHSAGGAYVNFMGDEGEDRIRASYRDNYDRLVAVKKKYDPQNLFHVNQNIKPNGMKA